MFAWEIQRVFLTLTPSHSQITSIVTVWWSQTITYKNTSSLVNPDCFTSLNTVCYSNDMSQYNMWEHAGYAEWCVMLKVDMVTLSKWLGVHTCQTVRQGWHRRCPQGWIRVSLSLSAQILHSWKVLPISQ